MKKILWLTVLLGLALFFLGMKVAAHRPLWNDEYYSLLSSTLGTSYSSIITGGIGEGNNSPLFYIFQKLQCAIFTYHPPQAWVSQQWGGVYVFDQIFLRVQSVFFMSLAVAILFYYFSRRNSWMTGAYAVAITLTSSLFWFHWTESRPYALWFSLSLFQMMVLLKLLEAPADQNKKNLTCLALIHWLLASTAIISVVQIVAAAIVLWIFNRPKLSWYLAILLLPVAICGFYYLRAPHYPFFFVDGPVALINANIPKDRLFIIFISAVVLYFQCRKKDWATRLEIKYLSFLLLMLGAFSFLLLKMKYSHISGKGFEVSNRYFLSLTPAGIMGVVLFSNYLVNAFSSKVWRAFVVVVLAGLLAFRFHKVIESLPTTLVWFWKNDKI